MSGERWEIEAEDEDEVEVEEEVEKRLSELEAGVGGSRCAATAVVLTIAEGVEGGGGGDDGG